MRRFRSSHEMNDEKYVLRYAFDATKGSLMAVLDGVPRGSAIEPGYVSHQLWRLRRVMEGRAARKHPRAVSIVRGVQDGKTSGGALVIAIAARGLGPRAAEPIAHRPEWTLEALAPELAALTVVRKLLEDRKLFVGSRVLGRGPARGASLKAEGLGPLLAASCGAYKITEQADQTASRIIRPPGLHRRTPRSPRAFELLVSGPSGWARRAMRPKRAILKDLALRLLSNDLIASVSPGARESVVGLVEVLRLRGVFSETDLRDRLRLASLSSVLAETMAVAGLAASVRGWRIGGLSQSGPFSRPLLD